MPTTDRSGTSIYYETHGEPDGVPLQLVHGLGAQLVGWDPEFVEALTDRGFFVITHDNRDVGLSQWFDEVEVDVIAAMRGQRVAAPYTLIDMANDAVGVLDDLGIEKAHVLGVSMGGMIAQTMALEYPTRVATLTSIMSTTGDGDLPGPTPEARAALLRPPATERDEAIEAAVASFRVIGSPDHFDEDFIRERAAQSYDRAFHPAGLARQLVGVIASGSRGDALRELDVPTLVVHGTVDPLVRIDGGRRTAERIPGAELLEIEGMGHDLPRIFQPQIIEAVTALAARVEAPV